ncbi:MAG: lytic transglycosylase domain-containing protein [Marmoricola sp.]
MTRRSNEATVVAAVVVVLLCLLIAVGVLINVGGANPSYADAPSTLTTQAAPAQVATVGQEQAAGDPLKASDAWITRTSQASGISPTAVAAYGDATLQIAHSQPSCHLGWSTLAGVGTVESENGTIGGRQLLANGLSTSPISGPALNGAGGYAAIQSAGGGWSSALGPMQFIPSTWDRWGADGDGDGYIDINNIFDAALATARYLCADGHDLATAQGWTAAIYSYNHSADYVQQVYAAANAAAR